MIVTLMGGLANTLFQYAFGISVAKARGEEVLFTRNRVDADVKRSYGLDIFCANIDFAEQETEDKFYDNGAFNPTAYTSSPNTTFIGYWQNEKWFDEPLVRLCTRQLHMYSDKTMRIAAEIAEAPNSTFIHVRRGDYVNERHTSEFHGNLLLDYYSKAIRRIEDSAYPKFFVFSDDPEWCRKQFPRNFIIVGHNKPGDGKAPGREHEDLFLMSLCRHAIIANSAFSWWGAWLGDEQKGRMVIAPKQWFQDPGANSSDIVPNRWVKI